MREYKENISKKEVIGLFLNGKSMRSIAKIVGCSYPYVFKILKNNGYKDNIQKKEITTNDSFFANYNKLSCYWAGFFAADGNLFKDRDGGSAIKIELSVIDCDHLFIFKKLLNLSQDVKFRERISFGKKHQYSYVQFRSAKIMRDLILNFNIVAKKSLILIPPPLSIDEKYVKDYIRGYLDGDGCICDDINRFRISFVGTKSFLEWIKEKIKINLYDITNPSVNKKTDCEYTYSLEYTGMQIFTILDWLYEDSDNNMRLLRKYNVYAKLKNEVLGHTHSLPIL